MKWKTPYRCSDPRRPAGHECPRCAILSTALDPKEPSLSLSWWAQNQKKHLSALQHFKSMASLFLLQRGCFLFNHLPLLSLLVTLLHFCCTHSACITNTASQATDTFGLLRINSFIKNTLITPHL
jgi:hypothetical protein